MSKVTASTDIQQVKPEDVPRFTDLALQDIVRVLNGDVDFTNNINCKIVSVTFSAANVSQSVSHGLGRVPSGYWITKRNASANVFDGSGGSSSSTYSLQASAPVTCSILFF